MSITRILEPLPGERVLALAPATAEAATLHWLRRPNLFPGRALNAGALLQRQLWQAGHIAARGRDFVPGVVDGLEVAARDAADAESTGFDTTALQVGRGRALCASGEDVVLARALECRLADVPVVAPARFFDDGSGVADPTADGSLRERIVGDRLGALGAAARAALPAFGVLVLQPAAIEVASFDALDACDRTPWGDRNDTAASEDWRSRDALRLLWYVWPSEWVSSAAPPAQPRTPAQMRTLLAARIFAAETALAADECLPWEVFGAPVALVQLDLDAAVPLWLDRASVVRRGSRTRDARLRAGAQRLASHPRLPALWQARIEQFAEVVAAVGDVPAARLAADFPDALPPVGLLPRNAFDPATRGSDFFPLGFDLDATPVPVDQLDLAVRASAGLAPLNPGAAESVRLLVPVPLAHWEPGLLLTEAVAPEFQQTLDRFALDRARALGARQGQRVKAGVLAHAIDGRRPTVPAFDDDAPTDDETLSPWGPPPAGGGHRSALRDGLHQHFFDRSSAVHAVSGDRLYLHVCLDPEHPPRQLMLQWHPVGGDWSHRAFWGEDLIAWGAAGTASRRRLGDLPDTGRWLRLEVPLAQVGLPAGARLDGMAFTLFDGRAAYGMTGSGSGSQTAKWFCNVLPEGAQLQGDEPWELLPHNDLWAPFEAAFGVGRVAPGPLPATAGGHTEPPADGVHAHGATAISPRLALAAGERLFCWAYLDPNAPPRQLLLEWRTVQGFTGRARWGQPLAQLPAAGAELAAGALPPAGRWTRLEVDPAALNLGGELDGLRFITVDGQAAFGVNGALTANGAERPWFSDAPRGGTLQGSWIRLAPSDMAAPTLAAREGEVTALRTLHDSPALAPLSAAERARLHELGVQGLAELLRRRADRADDLADYAFVKVQTDIYRVRQLVLGATAATRLAVSPSLANIAQAETAVASQAQISDFVAQLRVPTPAPAPQALRSAKPTATAAAAAVAPVAVRASAPIAGSAGALVFAAPAPSFVSGRSDLFLFAPPPPPPPPPAPPPKALAVDTGIFVLDTGRVAAAPPPSPKEVAAAAPLVDAPFVRTTTIARRLEDPKSKEARDYATATRFDAMRALQEFAAALTAEDGGVTPGLFDGLQLHGLEGDEFLRDLQPQDGDEASGPVRARAFADFVRSPTLLNRLMTVPIRVIGDSGDPDESAFFSDTTDLSDHIVSLARQFEARIQHYRRAVQACEQLLTELRGQLGGLDVRRGAIGATLAEARHDVGVARALLDEETARVADVNARRQRVLAEEVKFLAYVRPREADNLLATPTHAVDPGLVAAPVPACLRQHEDVPDELDDMLRVVREAPADWFVAAPPLLQRFDRHDQLSRLLESSRARTLGLAAMPAFSVRAAATATSVARAITQVATRQAELLAPRLTAARTLDMARVAGLSWQTLRTQAEQQVSLADLAEGGHGRADLAREAARELDAIRRVAACLHAAFSATPAALRLQWAETMSAFDATPNLRNLASLARFGDLPSTVRREMQAYVDYLHAQVAPQQPAAVALVNDVVRMCLLLASHAPVDRIVTGRLARAVPAVRPGLRLPLTVIDPARLRVGMQAVLSRGGQVVARAVVEDIASQEVSARVEQVGGSGSVDLDETVQVQYSAAALISVQSSASKRTRFRG